MSRLPCLLLLLLVPSAVPGNALHVRGQEESFDDFDQQTAGYFSRIQRGRREFSFRPHGEGGVQQWQKLARKQLEVRIGLQRMASQLVRHRARVELGPGVERAGKYRRHRGWIETEPGIRVPFYLLVPRGNGPHPLAICPHGHDPGGWHAYAGAFLDGSQQKDVLAREGNIAEQLALAGYVAVAPATRGLARELTIPDIKGRHGKRDCRAQLMHCLLGGRTPIGERVWDLQKILDWALQLESVEREKVVMIGNSGGGVATVFTAAVDPRIRVAIPSCSFTSLTSEKGYIFHCDCCMVPGLRDWGTASDLGGLIAPRPLLVVHGTRDRLHSRKDVERNAAAVEKIYRTMDARQALQLSWGEGGHRFYPAIIFSFLEKHLPR